MFKRYLIPIQLLVHLTHYRQLVAKFKTNPGNFLESLPRHNPTDITYYRYIMRNRMIYVFEIHRIKTIRHNTDIRIARTLEYGLGLLGMYYMPGDFSPLPSQQIL